MYWQKGGGTYDPDEVDFCNGHCKNQFNCSNQVKQPLTQ